MEDINSLYKRKCSKLKNLNNPDYKTSMSDWKRNNEIYRLKGYIEALSDVKNKKVYTQERDILEEIYFQVPKDIQKIIEKCWRTK